MVKSVGEYKELIFLLILLDTQATAGFKSLLSTSKSNYNSAISSHCLLYTDCPGGKSSSFSPTVTIIISSVKLPIFRTNTGYLILFAI